MTDTWRLNLSLSAKVDGLVEQHELSRRGQPVHGLPLHPE